MIQDWQLNEIDLQLIALALQEDLGIVYKDVTTEALFNDSYVYEAKIISKHSEEITVAGIPVISAILDGFQSDYEVDVKINDGERLGCGETLCVLRGDARTLLMAERTILNFLRRLCAVATSTRGFVEAVKQTNTQILDTRKTTPGFRHLEKYAVYCGGGVNHRLGLYDAFMVKDTHIDRLGGMEKTLEKLPKRDDHHMAVIVEVRSMAELEVAIKHGQGKISRILLDNMDPELLLQCVKRCDGVFETEASGNLNLNTIKAVAHIGVDYASVGMMTHSAGNVDLSMKALQ